MKHAFRSSVSSLEDRLALASMGAAAQATPAVPLAVATTTMNHVFLDTLGRRPDPYALATLTPAMQAGLTMAQLTTGVVSSPEYIGKNISPSPTASSVANETQYVNSLYSNVLGRSADSFWLNAWVHAIETRAMTLGQVASAIVNSPEAATSSTSLFTKVVL